MGKPSKKKEKYSATYCWIRWTNLYPVPNPVLVPGPGRKRRRSLAGGLVWVLLGLVWLGSPFIVRLSECSTDVIQENDDNHRSSIYTASDERYYQLNLVQPDDTLKFNKRKSKTIQLKQKDILTNQHQPYHHHHLHHPVQLIDPNTGRNTMVNGNEVIQEKSNDAQNQTKSKKIRNRFQSTFNAATPTFKAINTDSLRLEAIKQQILSKLGLKSKPNITHEFSKQTILNTLSRADDMTLQNDELEPNARNYYDYFKLIDRHVFDSNSINNHYDFVTSKNHITNNMNTTYRGDSTFTNNHIIQDNDRINIDKDNNNKNLMDSKINTNYNSKHHITQKHQSTSYHPSKSKNHVCSQPDKHRSSTTTTTTTMTKMHNDVNHNNHKNDNISTNNHKLSVHRNPTTTITEPKDFYKINNFSDISDDRSDNNLLFVNGDDSSYHIDGQLLERHEPHQQPEQLNQPPDNIDAEPDDYFGRTREVITFAEQGKDFWHFKTKVEIFQIYATENIFSQ